MLSAQHGLSSGLAKPTDLFPPEHGRSGVAGRGALEVGLLAALQYEHAAEGAGRHHRAICGAERAPPLYERFGRARAAGDPPFHGVRTERAAAAGTPGNVMMMPAVGSRRQAHGRADTAPGEATYGRVCTENGPRAVPRETLTLYEHVVACIRLARGNAQGKR